MRGLTAVSQVEASDAARGAVLDEFNGENSRSIRRVGIRMGGSSSQKKSRLVFTPYQRTTSLAETPGACISAQIFRFSSSEQTRSFCRFVTSYPDGVH